MLEKLKPVSNSHNPGRTLLDIPRAHIRLGPKPQTLLLTGKATVVVTLLATNPVTRAVTVRATLGGTRTITLRGTHVVTIDLARV